MQRVFLALAATGALIGAAQLYAQAAPAATTSRYMATTNRTTLYNEGCSMGTAALSGIVILDFGEPYYSGGEGTWTYGNAFASDSDIVNAAEGFLDGFWNCSPSAPQLRLAIGTSNYGGHTGNSAGQAWGNAVNSLNSYISTKGYGSQEFARGAIDAEPGWDTEFTRTSSWIDGYNATTSKPLYDYGSADDCPYSGFSGNCDGWGQHGLWYVSWGNTDGYPVPEIYQWSMADQWYTESVYSSTSEANGRLGFLGTMTQYAACGCGSSTYTPAQGFDTLQNLLNGDSRTSTNMSYSTDISWAN
ncbi:MAG TPA: hypothetical protein VJP85_11385 [Candidatus Baltobacteraceae bacterium]|nr:hypothetical protein [Candidatus Baltobacteraceae bacterium]